MNPSDSDPESPASHRPASHRPAPRQPASRSPRRLIGDRQVSALGVGGANWSFGEPRDDARSIAFIREAVDLGVTLFDTARAYTTADEENHNERLLGAALRQAGMPDDVLVATKGGHYREGDGFPIDGRPDSLRRDCELSLRALGVERIGLYLLHHPDPATPLEDSVGALSDLRDEGKIDMVGVSNVTPEQFDVAAAVTVIDAVENEFSPYQPRDTAFIAGLHARGVAYLAYSPLGGRRLRDSPPARFGEIARREGSTIAQAILGWEWSIAPNVIPLLGTGSRRSLSEALARTAVVGRGEQGG